MFSYFITGSVKCRLWTYCVPLFMNFTRVRKQWGYCCHVLICVVKTIVCSLRFTLTNVLLENGILTAHILKFFPGKHVPRPPSGLHLWRSWAWLCCSTIPLFFSWQGWNLYVQWPPYGLERWLPHHADKKFLSQITYKESDVFGEGGWVVCIWKNAWVLNIWMQQFIRIIFFFSRAKPSDFLFLKVIGKGSFGKVSEAWFSSNLTISTWNPILISSCFLKGFSFQEQGGG